MTRQSNRGGDGRTTNPSGPLIVKVSTTRAVSRAEKRNRHRPAQRERVIKLPFYIRFVSRESSSATSPALSPFSFLLPYPSFMHLFFSISSIPSNPRRDLFFSSPSTPGWSPAGSRQLAALRRARPAARFGQFAAESGEHSRFNYTDNEVCSDQMPKG